MLVIAIALSNFERGSSGSSSTLPFSSFSRRLILVIMAAAWPYNLLRFPFGFWGPPCLPVPPPPLLPGCFASFLALNAATACLSRHSAIGWPFLPHAKHSPPNFGLSGSLVFALPQLPPFPSPLRFRRLFFLLLSRPLSPALPPTFPPPTLLPLVAVLVPVVSARFCRVCSKSAMKDRQTVFPPVNQCPQSLDVRTKVSASLNVHAFRLAT